MTLPATGRFFSFDELAKALEAEGAIAALSDAAKRCEQEGQRIGAEVDGMGGPDKGPRNRRKRREADEWLELGKRLHRIVALFIRAKPAQFRQG